ncbi:MAG: HD family phosphohydrolase [Melioribacteraceae bacterium]|nr:MAG: HD family phosphohydrolase [Melioribacteraceae bacterium]
MKEDNLTMQDRKERTKKYVEQIQNLPSFPVVIMEVSKLLDDPKTSAADLGKVISKDQGMVAKILRIANSPLFGLPRKVSTIEFAIVILGYNQIKNIIIALAALESFSSKENKDWDKNRFWTHSVLTATLAKKIAEELGYRKSGEVFIAGLLHDLGISLIQRYFNKEFKAINELVESGHFSYLEAEENVIELTHQDIGNYLAAKWNLPSALGEVILHHHAPSKAEAYGEIAAIVHIADYMTQYYQVGDFEWDKEMNLDFDVIKILNLGDMDYLQEFILSYENLIKEQASNLIF